MRRYSIVVLLFILITSHVYAQKDEKTKMVTFNFVDVDLPVVAKFVSDITGKNFIFDERVKGKITIIAPSKLNIDQAYELFLSVLELKGFTVVPSGVDAYKIIPSSEARQKGLPLIQLREKVNESYIARLVSLKYISSEDALKFIQPLVSRDGYASSFGPGNLILIVDSGMNIEKILSMLEIIDQPSKEMEPEIIFLKYASSDALSRILNDGFSKMRQRVQTSDLWIGSDPRINAIIVFGDPEKKQMVRKLVSMLDIQPEGARGRVNVYFLENADAEELAKVLDGIIKGTTQRTAQQPGAPPPVFESPASISVSADKSTNSLVIVASQADYQNLVDVIKQLDRRRKQVFVEAMIVEASIDKLMDIGTKWRAIGTRKGEPVALGGFGMMDTSSIYSIITGLSGLTMGGMGNFLDIPVTRINPDGSVTTSTLTVPGFAALFSLDIFRGAVDVLSTPRILTSDNKEAEIVVGENVPFISKRERDVAAQNILLSSIERKDVGITLRITPHITEGDSVKLDIYQEISSLKKEPNTDILINIGPTTTKRSTKTTILVKDRQTVVISGLMQERQEEVVRKIPLLGDIPILGWLFKSKSVQKTKTNLLVFITPHIVKESEDLASITDEKSREFAVSNEIYVKGEGIIRFKEGVTRERIDEILKDSGSEIIEYIERINSFRIRLPEDMDVKEAQKRFSRIPEVELFEPNYTVRKRFD